MKINGKELANKVLASLENDIDNLINNRDIIPHLVIILIGNDPASVSYVKAKKIKAEELDCLVEVEQLESISEEKLYHLITKYNGDKSVHGIIVQRPTPKEINTSQLNVMIDPKKDIDGFHPQSHFDPPIALAVLAILQFIHESHDNSEFNKWLRSNKITLIGKGETGGGPVISALKKMRIEPTVIDSKTLNSELSTLNSDIIITAVGKPHIVSSENIRKDSILISLGMHKESDGKFHGDFEENDIEKKAAWYTPTPGGIGPLNVAFLFKNLVTAAQNLS